MQFPVQVQKHQKVFIIADFSTIRFYCHIRTPQCSVEKSQSIDLKTEFIKGVFFKTEYPRSDYHFQLPKVVITKYHTKGIVYFNVQYHIKLCGRGLA